MIPEDLPARFFSQVYRWAWILTLIGAVILGVSGSLLIALNFAAGTGLSVMLVRITQTLVQRYLVPSDQLQHQRQKLLILLLIKLPVLVVICGVIIMSPWFHPAGFMIGVGIMPILIVVFGGKMALTAS